MKNEIILKHIPDLEAIHQCHYILQDGACPATYSTTETVEAGVNWEAFESAVYTQNSGMAIAYRIRRWLEKRLKRELHQQYDWWVNCNNNEAYQPPGDITVIYYAQTSPQSGQFRIWSNKITPKQNYAYAFPGNVVYHHTQGSNDRITITYSFNYAT